MRLFAVFLLLPLCAACEGSGGKSTSVTDSSQPPSTATGAVQAAQNACSVYKEAPLWDAREVDTNEDGANDFTEVFTASGSDARVLRIREAAETASGDARFRDLGTAVAFLASVHDRGGDRSEVTEAEVQMTAACDAIGD